MFSLAIAISIVYLVVRFIEMRFVNKDSIPLKLLFRDTLFVFFSVIAGQFVVQQLSSAFDDNMSGGSSSPAVFTDNPEF
jgi:hypothetical protein